MDKILLSSTTIKILIFVFLTTRHYVYLPIISHAQEDSTYTYDNVGNITQIVDDSDTALAKTLDFAYDDLYRLTNATKLGDYDFVYTYDSIGNIISNSALGAYSYDETGYANPNAMTEVNDITYGYDNNGNMIDDEDWGYTYNYRNNLIQAYREGSPVSVYSYDHENSRVHKNTGSDVRFYPSKYSDYGNISSDPDGNNESKYAYINNVKVMTMTDDNVIYYLHTDHLNSTSVITDKNGLVVELIDYQPFGQIDNNVKAGDYENRHKYSNHEYEDNIDLYYMGARYQNPEIGRFTGVDPVVANMANKKFYSILDNSYQGEQEKERKILAKYLSNPQSLNGYSYVKNNPYNRIDPTGEIDVHKGDASPEQVKAFNNALTQLQTDVANNQEIQDYFQTFGVDINYALLDNGKGADVYINKEVASGDKGYYNWITNNISITQHAYEGGEVEIASTLLHEMGHWANDVGKLRGNLNPSISGYTKYINNLNYRAKIDPEFNDRYKQDSFYGYLGPVILYNYIPSD